MESSESIPIRDKSPSIHDKSPSQSPKAKATRPISLYTADQKLHQARAASANLQTAFDKLVEDSPKSDMGTAQELEHASLGIKLAHQKKKELQLERHVITQENGAGIIDEFECKKRMRDVSSRYLSIGEELWRHEKKKIRLDNPPVHPTGTGPVNPLIDLQQGGSNTAKAIAALYRKADGLTKEQRPKKWRKEALAYYAGTEELPERDESDDAPMVWCHARGMWQHHHWVKTAHIVPFFVDANEMGTILFGDRAPSLKGPTNSLLLSAKIKGWFDKYLFVIVPVDAYESPITRWRIEITSKDMLQNSMGPEDKVPPFGRELDGRELIFRNDNRPASRFMYFHFVMSLIRIKNINRKGWEDVWAKYYEVPPFATPTKYVRSTMLLALATHFGTTDMEVVNGWISRHGLDIPLLISDSVTTEAARRAYLAVEEVAVNADKVDENEDENDNDKEDETEDENDKE
ncbi:hypothetical protein QBC39DRAFT_44383 [Podospora conica]|nr:hypothetical protein QBC39DRAFT_44383 [Schizothecium conicum]